MRKQDETELPSPNARRWTIRRKLAVLQALHDGALTLEQARERYALSVEEIRAWTVISNITASMAYGRPGSRFTADPEPISAMANEAGGERGEAVQECVPVSSLRDIAFLPIDAGRGRRESRAALNVYVDDRWTGCQRVL